MPKRSSTCQIRNCRKGKSFMTFNLNLSNSNISYIPHFSSSVSSRLRVHVRIYLFRALRAYALIVTFTRESFLQFSLNRVRSTDRSRREKTNDIIKARLTAFLAHPYSPTSSLVVAIGEGARIALSSSWPLPGRHWTTTQTSVSRG
jgi:hypothetical protein